MVPRAHLSDNIIVWFVNVKAFQYEQVLPGSFGVLKY